jgi:hypothetical protein
MPKIVKSGIVYSSGSTVPAANIPYTPPSGSSSSSTTAKAALDELITSVEGLQNILSRIVMYNGTSSQGPYKLDYAVAYDKYTHVTHLHCDVTITGIAKEGDVYGCQYVSETGTGQQMPILDNVSKIVPVYNASGTHPVITEGDSVVISNASGAVGFLEMTLDNSNHSYPDIMFRPQGTFNENGIELTCAVDFVFIGQDFNYHPEA